MAALTLISPIGPLHVVADRERIIRFGFGPATQADEPSPLADAAACWVAAYFAGNPRPFDLPLAPSQTAFQANVRAAMLAIPFGETRSYGEIAKDVAGSARAVGQACGRNPVPILVPCHRVLGAGGALGGFSGGEGRATKRRLLAHEASFAFALTP